MWWNYIQTPHEARAEKCVFSPQLTLHSDTSLQRDNGQFALSLGKESPKGSGTISCFNQNMRIQPFLLAPRGKGRFLLAKELLYSFLEIVQC